MKVQLEEGGSKVEPVRTNAAGNTTIEFSSSISKEKKKIVRNGNPFRRGPRKKKSKAEKRNGVVKSINDNIFLVENNISEIESDLGEIFEIVEGKFNGKSGKQLEVIESSITSKLFETNAVMRIIAKKMAVLVALLNEDKTNEVLDALRRVNHNFDFLQEEMIPAEEIRDGIETLVTMLLNEYQDIKVYENEELPSGLSESAKNKLIMASKESKELLEEKRKMVQAISDSLIDKMNNSIVQNTLVKNMVSDLSIISNYVQETVDS